MSTWQEAYRDKNYDKDTDYMAVMQAAEKRGDLAAAAAAEKLRNGKIIGENLDLPLSSRYANYDAASGGFSGEGLYSNTGQGLGAGSANSSAASLTRDLKQRPVNNMSAYINRLYEAQKQNQLAALETAYRDMEAQLDLSAESISPYFYEAKRMTAADAALASANFSEFAAASGLNVGASAQAALARSSNYLGSLASLHKSEASALAEVELQRTQLARQYSAMIAEAEASSDYARMQALYSEAVRVDESLVAQALQYDKLKYGYSSLEANNSYRLLELERKYQQAQSEAAWKEKVFDYESQRDTELYLADQAYKQWQMRLKEQQEARDQAVFAAKYG